MCVRALRRFEALSGASRPHGPWAPHASDAWFSLGIYIYIYVFIFLIYLLCKLSYLSSNQFVRSSLLSLLNFEIASLSPMKAYLMIRFGLRKPVSWTNAPKLALHKSVGNYVLCLENYAPDISA